VGDLKRDMLGTWYWSVASGKRWTEISLKEAGWERDLDKLSSGE